MYTQRTRSVGIRQVGVGAREQLIQCVGNPRGRYEFSLQYSILDNIERLPDVLAIEELLSLDVHELVVTDHMSGMNPVIEELVVTGGDVTIELSRKCEEPVGAGLLSDRCGSSRRRK